MHVLVYLEDMLQRKPNAEAGESIRYLLVLNEAEPFPKRDEDPSRSQSTEPRQGTLHILDKEGPECEASSGQGASHLTNGSANRCLTGTES